MPGITRAPVWGPNLSNVACCLWVGHWVLPRRPLLHRKQFFHQSVECPEWTLDLTSLEHAGTQSSTVSLSLNSQYKPAQYRAAAGACSESVASP